MAPEAGSMRWLLSKLGLFKKEKISDGLKEELSFFQASAELNAIHCQWSLRRQTKEQIRQNPAITLMIRIRDASGDGTIATKSLEIRRDATEAQIDIPNQNGQMLLELGYKIPEGDFITLEYQFIDFGPKANVAPEPGNWFSNESDDIHQEMYVLATRERPLGGSELIQIDHPTIAPD